MQKRCQDNGECEKYSKKGYKQKIYQQFVDLGDSKGLIASIKINYLNNNKKSGNNNKKPGQSNYSNGGDNINTVDSGGNKATTEVSNNNNGASTGDTALPS